MTTALPYFKGDNLFCLVRIRTLLFYLLHSVLGPWSQSLQGLSLSHDKDCQANFLSLFALLLLHLPFKAALLLWISVSKDRPQLAQWQYPWKEPGFCMKTGVGNHHTASYLLCGHDQVILYTWGSASSCRKWDNKNYFRWLIWQMRIIYLKRSLRNSGQDRGVGRYTLPPHTTKRKTTTNLKTKNNQNCHKNQTVWKSNNQEVKETFT